jgi:hypothetical protein
VLSHGLPSFFDRVVERIPQSLFETMWNLFVDPGEPEPEFPSQFPLISLKSILSAKKAAMARGKIK